MSEGVIPVFNDITPSPLVHNHPAAEVPLEKRLCNLTEVENGVWRNGSWEPPSGCRLRADLELLRQKNVTFIWTGNSIMRHTFFRLGELMAGKHRGVVDYEGREEEKMKCNKDPEQGECSCQIPVHRGDNTTTYYCFIWQQEWIDDRLRATWDRKIADGAEVYMVMNAGLVWAWHEGLNSVQRMQAQLPSLLDWCKSLPNKVKLIYTQSTHTLRPHWGEAVLAQNAVMRAQFPRHDPRMTLLNLWPTSSAAIDYVDDNHFSGRTVEANIDVILHVFLNWDAVVLPSSGI